MQSDEKRYLITFEQVATSPEKALREIRNPHFGMEVEGVSSPDANGRIHLFASLNTEYEDGQVVTEPYPQLLALHAVLEDLRPHLGSLAANAAPDVAAILARVSPALDGADEVLVGFQKPSAPEEVRQCEAPDSTGLNL